MSAVRVLGIIVAVVGAVLLYFGLNGSHSLADQASHTLLGRYTDQTMTYIVLGIAALVGGALAAVTARR